MVFLRCIEVYKLLTIGHYMQPTILYNTADCTASFITFSFVKTNFSDLKSKMADWACGLSWTPPSKLY